MWRSIGVIPQAMTGDVELSVRENLPIYAKLSGVPRAALADLGLFAAMVMG